MEKEEISFVQPGVNGEGVEVGEAVERYPGESPSKRQRRNLSDESIASGEEAFASRTEGEETGETGKSLFERIGAFELRGPVPLLTNAISFSYESKRIERARRAEVASNFDLQDVPEEVKLIIKRTDQVRVHVQEMVQSSNKKA